MTIAILNDTAALHALAAEWHVLWRDTPGATPFQSPHWLLPWWTVFGTSSPRVATWRANGRLAGVLPAYVLTDPAGPKLLPIGAGTTDYLDALGDGAAPMLHALLARAAADGVGRFDLIEVPPDSPLHDVKPPAAWEMTRSVGSPCPVLAPIAIPAAMRRNLRMSRNRSARIGGATTDHATAATLAPALDALIALHQARWTGQGEPGVLADPAVLRFHRLAAPGLLDAGLLRLTLLRIGGDPAAAAMMLLDRSRIHFYLSGYEVALRHVSPGTLIVGALLEQATIEGRSEVHFLRGDEAYKYAWGAVDRWNATIAFTARR